MNKGWELTWKSGSANPFQEKLQEQTCENTKKPRKSRRTHNDLLTRKHYLYVA